MSPGITALALEQLAWIRTPEALYFSRCAKETPAPTSATIKLLQGIFDLYRDQSFFILRHRLETNYELEAQDRGMIQLLAKRHARGPTPDFTGAIEIGTPPELFFETRSPRTRIEYQPGEVLVPETWQHRLFRMEEQIELQAVPHDSPRKIAAFALDDQHRLLGATAHSGIVNKSLHAEVCLVQDLYRGGLARFPAQGTFVVSMKPCRMCAAMIADFLPAKFSGKILYLRDHEGSRTRASALDGKNYFRIFESTDQ